jgi:hypothetical protein
MKYRPRGVRREGGPNEEAALRRRYRQHDVPERAFRAKPGPFSLSLEQ